MQTEAWEQYQLTNKNLEHVSHTIKILLEV